MNKYLMMRFAGQRGMTFQVAGEGNGAGGDADAVAAAAVATAAAAAAATAATEAAAALALAEAAKVIEVDGKKLSTVEADLLREVMDKKTKLKTAEANEATAKAALEAYEGVDPAKVKALLKAEADAEKTAADSRGDFERVKTMMADEHAKDTAALQARIDALQVSDAGKNKVIDNLTIGADFGNSTFIRENLTLSPTKARTIYGAHFEVVDGKTVCYDKPAGDKARTVMVDASGAPLGFEVALERIVKADPDLKTMLKANVVPGSNSKTTVAPIVAKSDSSKTFGVSRIAANLEGL